MRKIVATAALTIAAMAITGGTSYAAPEPSAQDVQSITHLAGDQGGIHYDTVRSDANKTVTTTLSGGTFALTDSGVQVLNATGAVTSTMPLAITDGVNMIAFQPKISEDGATLVATPIFEPVGWLCSPSSPRSRSIEAGAGLTSLVGVFIGGIVGIAIAVATMGIGIIALPFTALIGGLIGLAVGGAAGAAVPNSDQQDAWECST
ncbi:hypothetical protein VMT65_00195 [Nocardia sp. CDC153]|uniref:hypothetical protein n=1 Tax=Nocardia sp. CDC153 TaxID=3112167 RepID=UPI002DBA5685|nr:hypothetical protein [Nocardia sp. CDC153]MEC3951440.1 hypothetical protein [Nocardia sp. CDC153]